MLLKGAEIVIECLKEQGVDTIFGYPGGTILNITKQGYSGFSWMEGYAKEGLAGAFIHRLTRAYI